MKIVIFLVMLSISGCAGLVSVPPSTSPSPNPSPTLQIVTPALASGQTGVSYSVTLSASGGTAPYKWSLTTGSAPTGLLLAPTGSVYGMPSAAGSFSFTVQVADSSATPLTATKQFTVVIANSSGGLQMVTSSLPSGRSGSGYSAVLTATGGASPYSWSVTSGSLPAGLSLNSSTGTISGTPTQTGAFSFTVQAVDSSSPTQTATRPFTISITASGPSPVQITTATLANGQTGSTYSVGLAASGGTAPYFWSVTSGALPAGLALNYSTGSISGTPTRAGTSSFTIQAVDSGVPMQTASKALSIIISASGPSPVQITTTTLANGQAGTAYSAAMTGAGGTTPYSWSVTSGSLPPGLSLASSAGTITGTPAQAGTSSFTIQVTDSSAPGQIASKAFSITISSSGPSPLQVTTVGLPSGQVSSSYGASLSAKGGTTPYTWSVVSGSLPAGLTLAATTGQITGTPSTAGTFSFLMQVADSSSTAQTATQSFTVVISAAGAATPVTACGSLSQAGATYVLQNDISSVGTCITISASGITFNLNGHTITYDTGATGSVNGITAGSVTGSHITSSVAGGAVAQSTACKVDVQTTGGGLCTTADPIRMPQDVEIDHLLLVDYGLDNQAINLGSSGGTFVSIHDNQICPYHTKATLTHYANFGEIYMKSASNVTINNNDIGTTCLAITGQSHGFTSQMGIFLDSPNSNITITNNRIAIVSPVRDGYGIAMGCASSANIGFDFAFNTVSADRGIFVEGWNSSSSPGCGLGTIHDNTVSVKEASNEGYSVGDPLGIQVRFGAHDVQIYNNNITAYSGPGVCPAQFVTDTNSDCVSQGGIKLMGGTTAFNNQAYNNTINAITTSASFPVTGIYADLTPPDTVSGIFNNRVTSNGAIVDVSQPDGCGSGWTFKGNTFIEAANPLNFVTYHPVWFCNPGSDTTNNIFIDNTYVGPDAGPDNIAGGPTGSGNAFSYYIKWSYNVTVQNSSGSPLSGVTVSAVATGGGTENVSQITDASGKAQLILTEHYVSGTSPSSPNTVAYTPHTVTVTATGCRVAASPFQVTMNQTINQTLVCQ